MKKNPFLFCFSLLLLLLSTFHFSTHVQADDMSAYDSLEEMMEQDDVKMEGFEEEKTEKQGPKKGFLEEGGILKTPTPYVETTLPNLAKMYWRFNLLDIENDEDIDNFLFCTECETYTELRNHDFVWEGIRSRIRQYIEDNKSTFSNRLYFSTPIILERYDFERKGFALSEKSKFEAVKKIMLSDNLGNEQCYTRYHIKNYPHNVALTLKRPVYINFIKVDEDVAKMYMEYLHNETDVSVGYEGRVAYLKINATALYHMDTVMDPNFGDYAVFFGTIDSYELYADRGLFLKMGKRNLLLDD